MTSETPPPVAVEGPSARFGRSLAVVVGIDDYRGGISPLRCAVGDAQAIATALRRDHGFETWCLFDVPLPCLLTVLREELPFALGPRDRLLFYFAGHGVALDGDAGPVGYLLPADARRDDRDGFLPMHVLHGELARLPVRHALVILDCCCAGAFRWSSLRDVELGISTMYRERYDRFLRSPAWQVLTSASAVQLAIDHRGEGAPAHSPFARALLEGLGGAADYTGDNVITASELALFVRERVEPAEEQAGRYQTPQLSLLDRHDHGEFVFQVPNRTLALRSAPPLEESANPYRGLQSFQEADRKLFFGREAVAQRLAGFVASRRLTVVVGPSGSGKSSLVLAGVMPALREQGWTVLRPQRPGREPMLALDALARELRPEAARRDPAADWLAAASERGRSRPDRPWLVVIDQLEELLTHQPAEDDRRAFLGALAAALGAVPSLHLVVTVRADIEPQFHATALEARWADARFPVPGMTRDELRDIIEKPAAASVLHFEPSRLVERLIDDVALVPAPLPLLSFVLSELYRRCWERWKEGVTDRALREEDYREMGGVAGALTRRATALHDELVARDEAFRTTIRNLFIRMTALADGEIARRRVRLDALEYDDAAENLRIAEVVQKFDGARLISRGKERAEDGSERPYAEPNHDELVRGWVKVSRWIDEVDQPTGTRRLLDALQHGVHAWQAGKHARSLVWSDPRADVASALGAARPHIFNTHEARFIRLSVGLRRSRRRRLIGGLLAVIGVLAVATVVALWQRGIATRNEAVANEERRRADVEKEENRRQLARSYLERGRQLVIDDRALEAIPYLVAAREVSAAGEARVPGVPLRMLFAAAARSLPAFLLGHEQDVASVAFSADGARILTASQDRTARIWDGRTGTPISPPLEHRGPVNVAAFSADGERVITGSKDKTARVWDATTGRPISPSLEHEDSVLLAILSADGSRAVTASRRSVQLWDVATGKPLGPRLEHELEVNSIAFDLHESRIVTASEDDTARIWDARTGKLLTPPLQHEDWVVSAVFSPDGARVVTASRDRTAGVWSASTGKRLYPLKHHDPVTAAVFSPDGKRILTASGRTVRVWDLTTEELRTKSLEHQDPVSDASFSPDGDRVVTASGGGIRIWDVATGGLQFAHPRHQDSVRRAAFIADGSRVVSVSADAAVRIWDPARSPGPLPRPLKHESFVKSASFSPDDKLLLTGSMEHKDNDLKEPVYLARIWSVTTGESLFELPHPSFVLSTAFNSTGTRIVTTSSDRNVRIWEVTTGKLLATLTGDPDSGHGCPPDSAMFNHDSTRVVTASRDWTAIVWDLGTGRPLFPPLQHGGQVWSATFSPDGTRIVSASLDGTARIWDAVTGTRLHSFQHVRWVWGAAFNNDGTRVLTASVDNTARVWDAGTGQALLPPLQHGGGVQSALYSPDGSHIVTASDDHTARIWDAATGRVSTPPLEHEKGVSRATFSRDGTLVLTISDNKVRIWDAVTGRPLLAPLEHGSERVNVAAFSHDGRHLATASNDGLARIWEIPLDDRTSTEWKRAAERSPYVLVGGILSRRISPAVSVDTDHKVPGCR